MRSRWVEHDLRTVEAQRAPTLGEVAVVTDVDAHLANGGVEHGIAAGAGGEIELLPKPLGLGNVLLAVLAEIRAVGIDDSRCVEVQAGLHDFVHR